ncbi:unnamed protein product [Boreogadus saida]
MSGSLPSWCCRPGSCLLLLLLVSSSVVLSSEELLQEQVVSDYAFHRNIFSVCRDQSGRNCGSEGESRDGRSAPQRAQDVLEVVLGGRPTGTRVWPSVLLDYMRKQWKFRARTKKGVTK